MSDRKSKSHKKLNNFQKKKGLAVPQGPWMPISGEMIGSPAFTCLSRAAMLCLWRICGTHIYSARMENGKLAVPFDAFEQAGVSRKQIRSALDELEALGFIRRTRKGFQAYGTAPGMASEYRLTFEGMVEGEEFSHATHEWKRITTAEQAKAVLAKLTDKPRALTRQTAKNVIPIRRAA